MEVADLVVASGIGSGSMMGLFADSGSVAGGRRDVDGLGRSSGMAVHTLCTEPGYRWFLQMASVQTGNHSALSKKQTLRVASFQDT